MFNTTRVSDQFQLIAVCSIWNFPTKKVNQLSPLLLCLDSVDRSCLFLSLPCRSSFDHFDRRQLQRHVCCVVIAYPVSVDSSLPLLLLTRLFPVPFQPDTNRVFLSFIIYRIVSQPSVTPSSPGSASCPPHGSGCCIVFGLIVCASFRLSCWAENFPWPTFQTRISCWKVFCENARDDNEDAQQYCHRW